MWELKDIIMNISIFDLIDITIVAYVFYNVYLLIKETRAEQLIKGIVVLLLTSKISELMQFQVIHWILKNTMTVGLIALLIVFQPELRRALEHIGRTKFLIKSNIEGSVDIDKLVPEIIHTVNSLSKSKIGALIVFERDTGLNEIIQTGTLVDAKISRQILRNIFIPNTPLHDGAVVIRGDRVMAAGCFLPLTENNKLNQEVGTRHRAALGISEKSDCISLVVSEETGAISIADNGKLFKNIGEEELETYLKKNLKRDDERKLFRKGGE
ncbi:diadenylate cyclase CdaA [Proteocatella sphenisci]|uniref:diadenylate cyclase CdaA n=1 Tax=Proteocatella sphenisci TaxID=181070 RepID=UPI00048F9A5A|nr:diadenylate cyclase CdaA [Proteocatella sphenisci]